MGEGGENREAFVGERELVHAERFQLGDGGDEAEVVVGELAAVGHGEAAQGGNGFDGVKGVGGVEAFAELKGGEGKVKKMLEGSRRGVVGAEFEAFELGEFREMHGPGVGEVRMGEADAFQVRQMFAKFLQARIVDLAATVTDLGDLGPIGALGVGFASDLRADEREGRRRSPCLHR
jgi:hypothetical protein